MPRQLSILLSALIIFGMIQLGYQVRAQSPKTITNNIQSPKTITNSIGMNLVLIPKGTFPMGSPIGEAGADDDEEQHQVTISKDYYLGVTEVTQGQYEKVIRSNPSYFQSYYFQNRVIRKSDSSMYPVEQVSWEDAVEFCKKLSDLPEEKQAGRVYRLPTEAEWEYACRAGSKSAYSFGESSKSQQQNESSRKKKRSAYSFGESSKSLGNYAWFKDNSNNQTHPVGEKKANAWGLFDMHGNVAEWCSDWHDEYPKGAVSDPTGPKEGSSRVFRGGGWFFEAADCRSAKRSYNWPVVRLSNVGFRVALSSSGIPK